MLRPRKSCSKSDRVKKDYKKHTLESLESLLGGSILRIQVRTAVRGKGEGECHSPLHLGYISTILVSPKTIMQ